MSVLIKFTLKNIKEKKFRLCLILISIILSSALFFSSVAISVNIEQIYASQMRAYAGNSDIVIDKDDDNKSSLFYEQRFDEYGEELLYSVGSITSSGMYYGESEEENSLFIRGFDKNGLETISKPNYISQNSEEDFEGKQVIIGQKEAEKFNLQVGDPFIIEAFGENRVNLKVWAIVANTGLFQIRSSGSTQMVIVMPKATVQRLSGSGNKVNIMFVKAKSDDYSQLRVQISDNEKGFSVEEAISMEELRNSIEQISAIFKIMLVLVIFITVFIIYTSFKVIMMERLPIIGTFRSVGATKMSTNILMLSESLIYGLFGGTLGLGLGVVILNVMTNIMAYDPYTGMKSEFNLTFGTAHVIGTIVLACTLSLVSSIIPIVMVSKIPVKDIVLNKMEKVRKSKGWKKYVGIILLVLPIILIMSPFGKINILINVLLLVINVVGLIILIPTVMHIFINLYEKSIGYLLGNEVVLAIKSLRGNKNIINNIILLVIGIASLLMINVLSYSVSIEVADVYNDGNFEIWSWIGNMDKVNLNKVKSVEGVEDVLGSYNTYEVEVIGKDTSIGELNGINPLEYFEYWSYPMIGDKDEMLSSLDEGRNIIINKSLAEKMNLTIGDQIVLKLNDKFKTYTFIGMTNSLMNNGQTAYISEKYFRKDLKEIYFNTLFIKTNQEPDLVNDRIKKKFSKQGVWSRTVTGLQKDNEEGNNQIFVMLQGFSILTMVIGIFGVFNNYIVSMLSRKHSLAMYRSLGMSMKQMRKMLFLEAFFGGVFGGFMGVVAGLLFVFFSSYLMKGLDLPITMHVNTTYCLTAIVGGILVSVIASIGPVIKSSKLNIIEAIKYE